MKYNIRYTSEYISKLQIHQQEGNGDEVDESVATPMHQKKEFVVKAQEVSIFNTWVPEMEEGMENKFGIV